MFRYFFCIMNISQHFHDFIERDWFKALDDFHPFADGKFGGLFFQPVKEITSNASYVNFFETCYFIFPFQIFHIVCPFLLPVHDTVITGVFYCFLRLSGMSIA